MTAIASVTKHSGTTSNESVRSTSLDVKLSQLDQISTQHKTHSGQLSLLSVVVFSQIYDDSMSLILLDLEISLSKNYMYLYSHNILQQLLSSKY